VTILPSLQIKLGVQICSNSNYVHQWINNFPSQLPCSLRVGLWLFTCWDWGFESCWGHGCLSLVGVVCVVRYRSLCWANHLYKGVLLSVVCLCMIVKPR
jgi:hypothetical protein